MWWRHKQQSAFYQIPSIHKYFTDLTVRVCDFHTRSPFVWFWCWIWSRFSLCFFSLDSFLFALFRYWFHFDSRNLSSSFALHTACAAARETFMCKMKHWRWPNVLYTVFSSPLLPIFYFIYLLVASFSVFVLFSVWFFFVVIVVVVAVAPLFFLSRWCCCCCYFVLLFRVYNARVDCRCAVYTSFFCSFVRSFTILSLYSTITIIIISITWDFLLWRCCCSCFEAFGVVFVSSTSFAILFHQFRHLTMLNCGHALHSHYCSFSLSFSIILFPLGFHGAYMLIYRWRYSNRVVFLSTANTEWNCKITTTDGRKRDIFSNGFQTHAHSMS